MPYKIVKRKCRQADDDEGTWTVVRRDTGKQVSCHTSEKKAKGSIAARHVNESEVDEIVEAVLYRLLYGDAVL